MELTGAMMLFLAIIGWSVWGILYHSSKKPQTWHKVKAKVVQHEVHGNRFKPIVEFEYRGELVRCRTDYNTDKKGIEKMPIDSLIDISYCSDVIGRRAINFGHVFYSGIVQVEIPSIKMKNEKFSRRVDNSILGITIILTITALVIIAIGILN
ncbi:MAG TPA: hypothetical protein GXZ21_04850 [Clostridiales bacterium]|nr:hypothetical protein [Clostridiales bacterium]